MAARRPWYQRNGSAMIFGTLHMPDADHKWAYSAIIDMLNDRDQPIPDDAKFICGFTGLSRKKWNVVRAFLLNDRDAQGETRLTLTDRGDLTNPRFDRELATRRGDHQRSVEAGAKGGKISAAQRRAAQGDLDLSDDYRADKREINDPINAPRMENKSEIKEPDHNNNSDLAEPPPQATRARVRDKRLERREEEESKQPPNPTTPGEPDAARSLDIPIAQQDLLAIVNAVARVGGVALRPERIDSYLKFNVDIVKAWISDGISIDSTALPTITARLARSGDDPVGSIKFYDADVRKAHARAIGGKAARQVSPDERVASQRSTVALYRRMGRNDEADEIEAGLPPNTS